MPYRPHSSAIALVICTTAALLMQYTEICAIACNPVIEATWIIRCCGNTWLLSWAAFALNNILRPMAWATKKAPFVFAPKV